MKPIFACLAALVAASSAAVADDGIPAKTLQDLKAATVFIKVQAPRGNASGSGFVLKVDGNSALIVTNDHVVSPPRELGRATRIQVVFRSGQAAAERVVTATVVSTDPDRDLAILKVEDEKELPKPLDTTEKVELTETMTVYALGFPFGEALSTSKGNPAITIGKASISSIRQNDRGDVAIIQIDGDINPGNSGGPVVDSKGRLIGVAVAKVRGTNIGLVIPPRDLTGLLAGRIGALGLQQRRVSDGELELTIGLTLIDPLKKIKSATVRVAPRDALPSTFRKDPKGAWPPLPVGETVKLKIVDQKATGTITVKSNKQGQVPYEFQPAFTAEDGKEVVLSPAMNFLVFFLSGPEMIAKIGALSTSSKMIEEGKIEVTFELALSGQTDKIKEAKVRIARNELVPAPRDEQKDGWFLPLKVGETATLKVDGQKATGKITLTSQQKSNVPYIFQPAYVTTDGQEVCGLCKPGILVFFSPPPPPRISHVTLTTRQESDGSMKVFVEAELKDAEKIKSVTVRALRKADVPARFVKNADDTWPALPGEVEIVELKIDGQKATGTITLTSEEKGTIPYLFQAGYVEGDKEYFKQPATRILQFTKPVSTPAPKPAPKPPTNPTTPKPPRTTPKKEVESDPDGFQGPYEVDGLKAAALRLPDPYALIPCIRWANDAKEIVTLNEQGTLRRYAIPEFKLLAEVKLDEKVSWLSESAEGYIVTAWEAQQAWVIDPKTFKVEKKIPTSSAKRVLSAPNLSYAYAVNTLTRNTKVLVIDLKAGKSVKEYTSSDLSASFVGLDHSLLAPDGKLLYAAGNDGKVYCFSVNQEKIEQVASTELVVRVRPTTKEQTFLGLFISDDGKWLAAPSPSGNKLPMGMAQNPNQIAMFNTKNLAQPELALKPGSANHMARAVGYDVKTNRFCVIDLREFVVFDSTGAKLKSTRLPAELAGEARQFLFHPEGRRCVASVGSGKLVYFELPKE